VALNRYEATRRRDLILISDLQGTIDRTVPFGSCFS